MASVAKTSPAPNLTRKIAQTALFTLLEDDPLAVLVRHVERSGGYGRLVGVAGYARLYGYGSQAVSASYLMATNGCRALRDREDSFNRQRLACHCVKGLCPDWEGLSTAHVSNRIKDQKGGALDQKTLRNSGCSDVLRVADLVGCNGYASQP